MSTEAKIRWVPGAAKKPLAGLLHIQLPESKEYKDFIHQYSAFPPRRTREELLTDAPPNLSPLAQLIGCDKCMLLYTDHFFLDERVQPDYGQRLEGNIIEVGCSGMHTGLIAQAFCASKFKE